MELVDKASVEAERRVKKNGIKFTTAQRAALRLGVAAGINATIEECAQWSKDNKGFAE